MNCVGFYAELGIQTGEFKKFKAFRRMSLALLISRIMGKFVGEKGTLHAGSACA